MSDGPGAVIDVSAGSSPVEDVARAWQTHAREMLDAVGWKSETLFVRRHSGGASLVLSAPIDALYAATEVNEWAFEAGVAELAGEVVPDLAKGAEVLRGKIAEERNPGVLALRAAATSHGVAFLSDDDEVSVGMGVGSRTWPVGDLPDPARVSWDEIHDVPVVLVTGTNGKTTTVRILAAMVRSTRRTVGFSSTDGVFVDDVAVDAGDYSGPGGARLVLRDRRVEAAILETARGGMLRRGLSIGRADAAIVTNVAIDHLGEYGVADLEDIADAKLVVGRAVAGGGTLVLNADDPVLARRRAPDGATLVWTSLEVDHPTIREHMGSGGRAVVVSDGLLVRLHGEASRVVIPVADAPVTLGGAASYNISNVLGALALSPSLGVPDDASRAALKSFLPTPDRLPGRTNVLELGGVTVLVDFAHNPHGMDALVDMVLRMPAGRRLVVIGQAGDRDDASVRALARSSVRMLPERIIVKEMERHLRGREPGAVPGIIMEELKASGSDAQIGQAAGEVEAVRDALTWCKEGDLLVFPIHAEREAVLKLLEGLASAGWRPGDGLP